MITLMLQVELLPPLGDGSRETVTLALHAGYGDDPAVAHEIVACALASDDDWARLFGADGELVAVPVACVRAYATTGDPSPES